MPIQSIILDPRAKPHKQVLVHDTEAAELEAKYVSQMLTQAVVFAKPHGESSDGHQLCVLMEPHEIVQRACDIASLAVAEFRKRGWLVHTANIDELKPAD